MTLGLRNVQNATKGWEQSPAYYEVESRLFVKIISVDIMPDLYLLREIPGFYKSWSLKILHNHVG